MGVWRTGLLGIAGIMLSACSGISRPPVTASYVVSDTAGTRLGRAAEVHRAADQGASTFAPLARGTDALGARIGLIESAERSLDLQYYIWHKDQSGMRISQRLKVAAARGVRVRLLLDDIGASLADENLLALDALPNIEVRLFNPVSMRYTRKLGALLDFTRINRRMHNKLFLADNQVVILGGRNIGDEYFNARGEADFGDLDVLAIGPVVRYASAAFDVYWNSAHAWPIHAVVGKAEAESPVPVTTKAEQEEGVGDAILIRTLLGSKANFFQGQASLLVDDPDKIIRPPADTTGHLWPQLKTVISATHKELLLVSPYFVPGEAGVAFLADLQLRGVQVTVLTNSLAATDMSAVHSGYARYRKALLAAGVALWEVKPEASQMKHGGDDSKEPLIGNTLRSSLHAKTFIFDQRELFIGSLNLDPRSSALNTETGVLIRNADFAERLNRNIRKLLPESAYRLSLHASEISWNEWLPDVAAREFDHDPESSLLRRVWVKMLGLLPIEEQL